MPNAHLVDVQTKIFLEIFCFFIRTTLSYTIAKKNRQLAFFKDAFFKGQEDPTDFFNIFFIKLNFLVTTADRCVKHSKLN
ncbi:MAG TPA: hypothetical protein DCY53_00830 [Desulfobacteraceae bacterium]|nr:hypothetical protein [Desulfobacteraceae bacterium]